MLLVVVVVVVESELCVRVLQDMVFPP